MTELTDYLNIGEPGHLSLTSVKNAFTDALITGRTFSVQIKTLDGENVGDPFTGSETVPFDGVDPVSGDYHAFPPDTVTELLTGGEWYDAWWTSDGIRRRCSFIAVDGG